MYIYNIYINKYIYIFIFIYIYYYMSSCLHTWPHRRIRYDSFCPWHHKLATIKSVASRAKRICTPSLLQDELDNLRLIFTDNGFPINIINKCIEQAMEVKSVATEEDKNSIVFRLPYIGQKSSEFGHRIKKQVAAAYPTVKTTLSLQQRTHFRKSQRKACRRQQKVQ